MLKLDRITVENRIVTLFSLFPPHLVAAILKRETHVRKYLVSAGVLSPEVDGHERGEDEGE
jgi:hypothetical protein